MKRCKVTIVGQTPYSQSRIHATEFEEKERHDEYEKRTWREKAHYDPETREMFIPLSGMKLAIAACAKYLSLPIPGKGKQTFTKHFLSGIHVSEGGRLGIKVDDVRREAFMAHSNGQRGSGKRVMRMFPTIDPPWETTFLVLVVDDVIDKDTFERVVTETGKFIGLGRWRPENGGSFGLFEVKKFEWV